MALWPPGRLRALPRGVHTCDPAVATVAGEERTIRRGLARPCDKEARRTSYPLSGKRPPSVAKADATPHGPEREICWWSAAPKGAACIANCGKGRTLPTAVGKPPDSSAPAVRLVMVRPENKGLTTLQTSHQLGHEIPLRVISLSKEVPPAAARTAPGLAPSARRGQGKWDTCGKPVRVFHQEGSHVSPDGRSGNLRPMLPEAAAQPGYRPAGEQPCCSAAARLP